MDNLLHSDGAACIAVRLGAVLGQEVLTAIAVSRVARFHSRRREAARINANQSKSGRLIFNSVG